MTDFNYLTAAEIAEAKAITSTILPMATLPRTTAEVPATFTYRSKAYHADGGPSYRTSTHMGQRKLLLGEIEFITKCARRGDTVIYAGAGPGYHIPILIDLFADMNLRFLLYDRTPFSHKLNKAILYECYLTLDNLPKDLNPETLLFISDIRTNTDPLDKSPTGEDIAHDNALQQELVLALQPRAAMLKFRFPFVDESTLVEYFAGDIMLQAYAPQTSTETRLIIHRAPDGTYPIRTYDIKDHENRMFYVTNIYREWARFGHGLQIDGMCMCFDCSIEIAIWSDYDKTRIEKNILQTNAKLRAFKPKLHSFNSQLGMLDLIGAKTKRSCLANL